MSDNNVLFMRKSGELCKGSFFHKGPFEYDDNEAFVTCKSCKTHLTPMAVLKQLMRSDSVWRRRIEEAELHLNNIDKKLKTKCEHCNKMTIIKKTR